MLKRIIAFFIILNIITFPCFGAKYITKNNKVKYITKKNNSQLTKQYTQKEVTEYILKDLPNGNTVKRIDCICAIMRSIGTTEKMNYHYKYEFKSDDEIIGDVSVWEIQKAGYAIVAYLGAIAFGVKDKQFEPDRDTTVKECLAFMLRCLKDSKDVLWNNIFDDALNEGLITKEEFDVYDDDTYLKTDMFNTLIERFINKTRYKYIDKKDGCYNIYKFYKQTDTSDKMTYYEWLCDVIESQK